MVRHATPEMTVSRKAFLHSKSLETGMPVHMEIQGELGKIARKAWAEALLQFS